MTAVADIHARDQFDGIMGAHRGAEPAPSATTFEGEEPEFTLDTPLGPLRLTVLGPARVQVTGECTINRVDYSLHAVVTRDDDCNWGCDTRSLYRVHRIPGKMRDNPTANAYKRASDEAAKAVTLWASESDRDTDLLRGQAAQLNRRIEGKRDEVRTAREKLDNRAEELDALKRELAQVVGQLPASR